MNWDKLSDSVRKEFPQLAPYVRDFSRYQDWGITYAEGDRQITIVNIVDDKLNYFRILDKSEFPYRNHVSCSYEWKSVQVDSVRDVLSILHAIKSDIMWLMIWMRDTLQEADNLLVNLGFRKSRASILFAWYMDILPDSDLRIDILGPSTTNLGWTVTLSHFGGSIVFNRVTCNSAEDCLDLIMKEAALDGTK